MGPDDDPDFLRDLDRKRKHPEDRASERAAGVRRVEPARSAPDCADSARSRDRLRSAYECWLVVEK